MTTQSHARMSEHVSFHNLSQLRYTIKCKASNMPTSNHFFQAIKNQKKTNEDTPGLTYSEMLSLSASDRPDIKNRSHANLLKKPYYAPISKGPVQVSTKRLESNLDNDARISEIKRPQLQKK